MILSSSDHHDTNTVAQLALIASPSTLGLGPSTVLGGVCQQVRMCLLSPFVLHGASESGTHALAGFLVPAS